MKKLSFVVGLALAGLVASGALAAVVPGKPKPTADKSTYSCSSELGYMKRVYVSDLERVYDAEDIWVTPVCEGEDYGVFRSEGNAGSLRGYIGDSEVFLAALERANFNPEDVVAVRMTGDHKVTVYVHEFHH